MTSRFENDAISASIDQISDIELVDEMEESFLEYAYSVIYSRALPDARDGLKPVQRRIIYQMSQMGLSPEKGHVKSARVVGEVMGKLHPHGDSAIYDALVRMAQPFAMRVPMIDGHGNFGSLDDGPAAARYTEARLRPEAMAMVENLSENLVDFVPNYDNQVLQPSVLPSAFPNLLVNGASGIAVGMATNMAPHNIGEVIDATCFLIDNPEASLEDLMEHLPGPDLPTGGVLLGIEGIRDAYRTGKGAFRIRAKVKMETLGPRKNGLVVTELPYLVGPEKIIQKIKDLVASRKLLGISGITDLTDRTNGLRLEIEVKSGFEPMAVLEELYRLTPLEDNFSVNAVALVEGQPRSLGLREILQVFIEHRISVVTRRSKHRLAERQKRLHLIQGLLIAIADLDITIGLIRQAANPEKAAVSLMGQFNLSKEQASHILELRLRRLTKLSQHELETEQESLNEEIKSLQSTLSEPARLLAMVKSELHGIRSQFRTKRRSKISKTEPRSRRGPSGRREMEIADDKCIFALTSSGYAGRFTSPFSQPKVNRPLLACLETTVRGSLAAVTSAGNVVIFSPIDLPDLGKHKLGLSGGVQFRSYIGIEDASEKVVGVFNPEADPLLALGSARGVVKRVRLDMSAKNRPHALIKLAEGDRVVGISEAPDDSHIVLISAEGSLLNFSAALVRPQGFSASGMQGIRISESTEVIFMGACKRERGKVVTLSGSPDFLTGSGPTRVKTTPLTAFPEKGRATSGVRAHSFLKGEQILVSAVVTEKPLAEDSDGHAVTLPRENNKRDASGTQIENQIQILGSDYLSDVDPL